VSCIGRLFDSTLLVPKKQCQKQFLLCVWHAKAHFALCSSLCFSLLYFCTRCCC
jgi:acetyl-CoA acyltransferase